MNASRYVPPAGRLKVLAIGNSYSDDATDYLYRVFAAEGYADVTLGRLYYGGCRLKQHVQFFRDGEKPYIYAKNTADEWVERPNSGLLDGLLDEDWNVITMQQYSIDSGRPETYDDLDALVDIVNEHKPDLNAPYLWHMTWARQNGVAGEPYATYFNSDQTTMYNAVVGAVQQKILPRRDFVGVIPVGTAIQNARTSFIGDTLNRDGTHLNHRGKLIAAYTWFCVLTGRTSLDGMKFTAIEGGVTAEEVKAMTAAVNAALTAPFRVTPCMCD